MVPPKRRLSANKIADVTEKITPILAANTFGALSTIFLGRFNPETVPLAKVAKGLYFGLIKALIIKSTANTAIIPSAVCTELCSASHRAVTATIKTKPATTRTVVLSRLSSFLLFFI